MKNKPVAGAFSNSLRAGALLSTFALAGGSLLALTYSGTRERIAQNERAFTLRSLNEIVDIRRYDNDLFTDVVLVTDRDYLGSKEPVPVYRARKHGQAVAAIIPSPNSRSLRIRKPRPIKNIRKTSPSWESVWMRSASVT